jgi:hypothetical protein
MIYDLFGFSESLELSFCGVCFMKINIDVSKEKKAYTFSKERSYKGSYRSVLRGSS